MARRPRQPKDGLGGGNVPEDEFDEGPDTNVDERPAVQLSPLEPDSDPGETAVDQAPTIDPTTRRPLGARLTRPIRERQARPKTEAPPSKPAPDPKSGTKSGKGRLRLPLPAGMGGGAPADDDADTPVPALVTPSSAPPRPPMREPSEPAEKVPTMPGVQRRAQWPIVAAVAAVAVIVVAFLVASETTDEADPYAALGPNATAEARRAEQLRRAREGSAPGGHAVGPDGQTQNRRALEGARLVRKPPPAKARMPRPIPRKDTPPAQSLLSHEPSTEGYPDYPDDVAPPATKTILMVQSDPRGVPVWLDGMLIGTTPTMLPLTEDRKGGTIEFKHPGLKTKTTNFTVSGPGPLEVFEKLEVDEAHVARMKARAAQMKNNPLE